MSNPFARHKVFRHTGHIGDIIAFLPIYFGLGGEKLLICDDSGMEPMSGFKYDSLRPLLESQGIEVELNGNAPSITYDMSPWRECYRDNLSLLDAQARFIGYVNKWWGHVKIKEPWLKVNADPLTKDRVIFNKTPRYPNPKFDWSKVVKHFNDRSLFIGTKSEYKDFCSNYGFVDYYQTESCLDVAKAIAGADYFVGNQSSAFWIAAALQKPLLQEVFAPAPNSIIPYKRATYCYGGNIDFDNL